jgi:FkbM family methyltransferase
VSLLDDLAGALGLARSLAIYYGQPWRRSALKRFYAELIAPGDLAFDIGAHVGNRARTLHALGARVVAVEPQPLFERFLAATLPKERMILVAEAVGAEAGRATMAISRRHPTVSTLSAAWLATAKSADGFEKVRWDAVHEVPVTTLDALIARFGLPRFCKVDVEGLEAEILKGLSQPIPLLAVEYLPAALPIADACIDRLEALGDYRFNLVVGEIHRFVDPRWRAPAEIRSVLREVAADGRSGDLYARLEP